MARATTTKTAPRKSSAKSTTKTAAKSATRTTATKPKAAARSTSTARKTTAAAASGVVAPKPAEPKAAVAVARELKKKELVERVSAASGLKKAQARSAVEAMLDILGETIAKGEAMNLEPLGKMKVQNQKDAGAATVYACRVRRKKLDNAAPKPPLAAAAE
ncbi:MAG: HU family DNA-binding protein [Pseudomonadota bacterium]